ncbi:MAG: DUF4349 domain-containing protein [Bacteroidota bacterium]
MKTNTLLLAVATLLLACQPKKEKAPETEMNYDLNLSTVDALEAPAACAPPPVLETVKFLPPVIKDDAIESDAFHSGASPLTKDKKIIKDGSMSIKVKDVEAAKKRIDKIVKTHDAYYENESFENNDLRISYNLKVRIPAKQFESFLKESEKDEGEILYKNISARDVTEEYVDGEIRLNSKRLFRNRYNQLLEKAGKVEDILAIEENIRTLQEEIESQEGQLKFLDDQVSYSTLEITLFHQKTLSEPVIEKDSFFKRLKISLGNGWDMLVAGILWCIMQWPWYLLAIIIITGIKLYIRRRRKSL